MGPGQRRYIERRIAMLEARAGWLRMHDTPEWCREELAEIEPKLAALRQRLIIDEAARSMSLHGL